MLVVPLHVDGQPCHNCGRRSTSVTVNLQYLDGEGDLARANRVNPCGCLLGVAKASEARDSRDVRRVPEHSRRYG